MMFDVLVNGHKTSDYNNIWVANIPQIQSSETERDRHPVPQRDGDTLSAYYRRTSAYIEVTFHALNILQNRRIIKSVFCNQINEVLKTSITFPTISIINRVNGVDSYDSYFNIKNAVITEDVLNDNNYGRVTIQYEVEPFEYLRASTILQEDIQKNTSGTRVFRDVSNAGDVCKPFIEFNKGSSDTIIVEITVDNEKQINFTLNDDSTTVYCDSNLMFTYNSQGNKEPLFLTHNYDDLWLPNGVHEIDVYSNSFNASEDGEITIDLREGYAI